MILGNGRKIAQETVFQTKIRSIPLVGQRMYNRIWKDKPISDEKAGNPHEFNLTMSGFGKTREEFKKATEWLAAGNSVISFDAAGVLNNALILWCAEQGYPAEKIIICDPLWTPYLGTPQIDLLARNNETTPYEAAERLVNHTVSLSETRYGAGFRQLSLGRWAFWALGLANEPVTAISDFCLDEAIRTAICERTKNDQILRFWVGKDSYVHKLAPDAIEALRNKWENLCLHELVSPFFSSRKGTFDIFECMQSGVSLLINLTEKRLGNELRQLFAQCLLAAVKTATLQRQGETQKPPVMLLLEEFQQYKSPEIISFLRISRNENLKVALYCQDGKSFTPDEFFTILGNSATVMAGSCSYPDAVAMASEIFLHAGNSWRDWESTRNYSSQDELNAYAGLIMEQKPGQRIGRIKPSKDAVFVEIPPIELPKPNPRVDRMYREAVAKQWNVKDSHAAH